MQLHMFYLCTKSLGSYYQGINFIVKKFIIQDKLHSKQNYFHDFFLLKKKKLEFQTINFIVYNNIIWNNQYLNFHTYKC